VDDQPPTEEPLPRRNSDESTTVIHASVDSNCNEGPPLGPRERNSQAQSSNPAAQVNPEPATEPAWRQRLWKRLTGSPLRIGISTLGALLLAVVSGITGAWAPGLFSAQRGPTQVIFFTPWTVTDRLSSNVQVAAHDHGYCWTRSAVSPRPDAFRCFVGSTIYDPCFKSSGEYRPVTQVACAYPDPRHVTIIYLTRKLPRDPMPSPPSGRDKYPPTYFAWLLVLANGEYCWRFDGEEPTPGDLELNYHCPETNSNLYGNPEHSGGTWTILYQTVNAPDMTLEPIVRAYS